MTGNRYWKRFTRLIDAAMTELHQNDWPETYRASGEMRCTICGREYIYHPVYHDRSNADEVAHNHQICNGDVVHL